MKGDIFMGSSGEGKAQKVKKNHDPVPLDIMLGKGVFEAQGKKYYLRPLKLKMVDEFLADQLSIGAQLFNFTSPEVKEKLEKWIPMVLFRGGDNEGESGLTLTDIMEDDWDLDDLQRLWRGALKLSG